MVLMESGVIAQGILTIAMLGLVCSLMIHVLETITADGYVPRKERLRRKALLDSQKIKNNGKH